VSEGAKPVTDSAAVRGADEHPQSRSARRPALAEVAAATRGPRRFVSRIGAIVPASFILITIAVSSSLGQPLRGGVEAAELIVWAAFTLMLLTPFIAAALVMLTARRGGLVWTTTLVYAVLTGLLGVGVDVTVLGTDFPSASLSLVSALIVQVVLLAPVCAAVAFLVHIVSESARR
jgi:hypothetical protein